MHIYPLHPIWPKSCTVKELAEADPLKSTARSVEGAAGGSRKAVAGYKHPEKLWAETPGSEVVRCAAVVSVAFAVAFPFDIAETQEPRTRNARDIVH